MSSISKAQLKAVVKECLVEILMEGLASRPASAPQSTIARRAQVVSKQPAKVQVDESVQKNKAFNSTVKQSINILTDDPIMQSIFDDSARTSLQEQLGAEVPQNMNQSLIKEVVDAPLENFEEADRWAALAFAEPKKNKTEIGRYV